MDNHINLAHFGFNSLNYYKGVARNKKVDYQDKTKEEAEKENTDKFGGFSYFSKDSEAKKFVKTADIVEGKENESKREEEESKTNSKIVVKPDGSRVLMVTMNFGASKTTMSIEISKPTDMLNNTNQAEVMTEENISPNAACMEDTTDNAREKIISLYPKFDTMVPD